ncbi:unnamed protein product [Macrosiphum euphorbiae]|uniref:Uncharacterized protein n=1 Tax=Macrosiphum euphorbiae TaxID=13131 RepID=A0AAV0WMM7_9HEMI|nr:unnamed protein product [Macrosiphum euphorbiae]
MECRSPDMWRASSAVDVASAVGFPDFGVRALDCGEGRVSDFPVLQPQQQRLSATAVHSPFSVYADPVYVDFENGDGAVVISSGHPSSLGQVYLAVWFLNSTGGCRVTSLSRHEIICVPNSTTTATVLNQLRRIVVTVGGYECDVQKKSINAWDDGRSGSRSLLFTSVTFSCCSGVAIVSGAVLLFAVGVLLFRVITKNRYVISADT